MKILIFEGIATSGKSTLINQLRSALTGIKIHVASEAETHEPIMLKTSESCVNFFMDVIQELVAKQPDLLIFDRLYLTQAFRANLTLSKYADIEDLLSKYATTTVFLEVDEGLINSRISGAATHRESSWGEYLKTKGNNNEEIAQYYIDQQKGQLKLLKDSKLPYLIFNTSNNKYEDIAKKLIAKLS